MRILFITHSFKRGGAEQYLARLIAHCRKKGHECVLIGPTDGQEVQRFEDGCSSVVRTRLSTAHVATTDHKTLRNFVNLISNVWFVSRFITRLRPHIVYSNTSAVMAGALAARLTGVPHIWHIHENLETFQLRFVVPTSLMRHIITWCSARIIFVTELALRSLYPNGHEKAIVIHNGVVPAALPSSDPHSSRAASDGARAERLAFFGALAHRKGVDVLMRAVALVTSTHPQVRLDVWGEGDATYLAHLQELSASLGTDRHVTFKGHCPDVQSRLTGYDVVVVPSRAESFSLVALEAMAAGVPLIVTRCGGPEEFVEDGKEGCVVPVNDHLELAGAMQKLLDHPQVAADMAQRAKAVVDRNFQLSTKLDAILGQLEELAESHRA